MHEVSQPHVVTQPALPPHELPSQPEVALYAKTCAPSLTSHATAYTAAELEPLRSPEPKPRRRRGFPARPDRRGVGSFAEKTAVAETA